MTSPIRAKRWPFIAAFAVLFAVIPWSPLHASPRFPRTIARTLRLGSSPLKEAITLPIRANSIGMSWVGRPLDVSVRWRDVSSGWSDPKTLEPSDHAADARKGIIEGHIARVVTEPVWAGTIDRVALRVPAGAKDVRLELIDTLGDSKPPSFLSRILAFLTAPASEPQAEAAASQPTIISRAGWGADESWRRCCPRYAPTVEVAIIHHTDDSNTYTASQAAAVIRAIYHYHRFTRDFDDIAYNFLVDRFGRIYEGRYGGIERPVIGAHSEGVNTKSTGIAMIGTFSTASPPAVMVQGLENLLAWKLDVHHIPANGLVQMVSAGSSKIPKGSVVTLNRINGHRDTSNTDCPGTKLYNMLPAIRKATGAIGLPKFYLNSTPQTLRPDGDSVNDSITTKVWFSSAQVWKIVFSDKSGAAKKQFDGAGTYAEVSWDGKDALTGALGVTGLGSITIDGTDAQGHAAREAVVPIDYVFTHPQGSVLASNGTRVWIDANGSRSIATDAMAASWFRPTEPVATTGTELARYTPSTPLSYRDGTILKTPDGAYHFIDGGSRREFTTQQIYSSLGYTDASAITATQQEVDALPQGSAIDNPALHPEGSVVIDSNNVSWVISGGQKHKVPSLVVRRSSYRDAEVVPAAAGDLALPEGTGITFREGTLLKTPEGTYWIVSGGTRRPFADALFFGSFGHPPSAVLSAKWPEITILPYGTPLN